MAGPAFYLGRGVPLTTDISPPNRVLDLRLTAAHKDSLAVELAWTAPGGDYDFGKGEGTLHFTINSKMLGEQVWHYIVFQEKNKQNLCLFVDVLVHFVMIHLCS